MAKSGFQFEIDNGGYGMPYYRPRSSRTPNALGLIEPNAGGLQDTWKDVMFNWDQQHRGASLPSLTPFVNPGGAGSGSAPDFSNPFITLRNVKNPGIAAAAQSILGQISSLNTNPALQRDSVIRSIKSPELQQRIGSEFQNFDTDRTGNRSSLADFTANFLAADPQARAQTDQEISSVGEFYNGKVQSDLDKLAADRSLAVTGSADRALGAARRANRLGQLIRGGSDSYLDAGFQDKAGDIYTRAALDNAEQMKQNYTYAREGKNRLLGARSNLLNNYLMRGMVPTQVGQQVNANDLSRLGSIGAMDANNSFFRTTNPQQLLAEKLGLLTGASDLDLRNTFYGLKKPYEPNFSGFATNAGGPGAFNGFNFGPAADAILRNPGGPSIEGFSLPQPVPGSVPANVWTDLPGDMRAQVANQGFDWGVGSAASLAGLSGTSFNANGQRFIRNADGSVSVVGGDGLTDAQRYYDTPNFDDPGYQIRNLPGTTGVDSVPFLAGAYAYA